MFGGRWYCWNNVCVYKILLSGGSTLVVLGSAPCLGEKSGSNPPSVVVPPLSLARE